MDKLELAKKIIIDNGGTAKNADFLNAGLSNYDLMVLHNKGMIDRVVRGLYQLPYSTNLREEQLIKELLPKGIVCMESALFHYGYSNSCPHEWSLAVPRTSTNQVKKIVGFSLKPYFTRKEIIDIGKITDEFNGVSLAVYDRERTICDCFRYRTKLDSELFNKAVNAYAVDNKKNLDNLSTYAKKMKIYNKVMNVMEVLLDT